MLDKKFVSRWRVQKVAAHQSRVEVDLGRLSHHEWSGNSKAAEMARSGATRFAVAPDDVCAHGAAWDEAADLAHFSSGTALYICSSGRPMPKVRMRWRFEMLFLWLVLGSRSRFTKLCGPLVAGDAPDANDMLATSQRWLHSKGRPAYHCLVLLEGLLHHLREVDSSHRIRRSGPITWCTMCAAYSLNRSFALRQCCL